MKFNTFGARHFHNNDYNRNDQKKEMQIPIDRYPELAVFLAAGLGKRLLPYTQITPKPLLKVRNQPILSYLFNGLKKTAIRKVIIITHYLESQIITYADEKFSKDFDIQYCHQPIPNGSAGALKCAADIIKKENCHYFLVSAADYQTPVLYFKRFINFHLSGNHDLSVGIRELSKDKVRDSNITVLGEADRILSMVEKPSFHLRNDIYESSYLIYICPIRSLNYLYKIQMSDRNEYELPEMINIMIRENYDVKGFPYKRFKDWEDRYRRS